MSNIVDLQNVTKLYGTVIGVNDITLSLTPGAYGLLGPNGAGKSTLLNLITGQLRPTLGGLRVLGHHPRRSTAYYKQIGYLPGSEGMYANVSAFEWVTYLTAMHGHGRRAAASLATEALERVGMTEHMHRRIAQYSRGMRQRARLAQAIAHGPTLLVLDEPFNGLDPIARHDITTFLREWIAGGRSLILASHVLHEIESITRSFLLICGGRLLASGDADDVHEMLADVPSEMRIRTDRPRELAAALFEQGLATTVRQAEGDLLLATTQAPLKVYGYLSQAVAENRFRISEFHAADESLQGVFDSLMRIHRGQL